MKSSKDNYVNQFDKGLDKDIAIVTGDLTKKNSGNKVLKALSKKRLADEKPTRDYSDLTLKTREDRLTEIFLKDHNYTEIDSLTETIKKSNERGWIFWLHCKC